MLENETFGAAGIELIGAEDPQPFELVNPAGNRRLTSNELDARANAFFWPDHRAIAAAIAERRDGKRCPVVLSIHSYTGEMNGVNRPWQLGVLSGWDRRIADPLLRGLQERGGFTIGDNEPYSGLDLYG